MSKKIIQNFDLLKNKFEEFSNMKNQKLHS